MKKNNQYEINFATNTIIVTKNFLQAASQMDTPEYVTMTQLRALNMPITVREIHRVPKERRWSEKQMETFIRNTVDSDRNMVDFQKTMETYGYMKTWSWFKKTFANYKTAKLNENHLFVTMTKEQMEAEKKREAFTEKASSSNELEENVA